VSYAPHNVYGDRVDTMTGRPTSPPEPRSGEPFTVMLYDRANAERDVVVWVDNDLDRAHDQAWVLAQSSGRMHYVVDRGGCLASRPDTGCRFWMPRPDPEADQHCGLPSVAYFYDLGVTPMCVGDLFRTYAPVRAKLAQR